MADTSATQIIIGGEITSLEAFGILVEAIIGEGVGMEWGGGFEVDALEHALLDAVRSKRNITFYDTQAGGGEFPGIETACTNLALEYVRADDGHYAYPPSKEALKGGLFWHAGGTIDESPRIDIDTLMPLLATPEKLAAKVKEIWDAFADPGPMTMSAGVFAEIERRVEVEQENV